MDHLHIFMEHVAIDFNKIWKKTDTESYSMRRCFSSIEIRWIDIFKQLVTASPIGVTFYQYLLVKT